MLNCGTEKRRSLQVIVFELKTGVKNVKNGAFIEVVAVGEFCREIERTGTIFDSKNPFWEETLNLNLPEEAVKVMVRYKSVNRKTEKVKLVASLTLDIRSFNSQEVREDWFILVPESISSSSKKKIKLRIALNYMEDICLSEIDYIPLIDFLLDDIDSFLLYSNFIKKDQTDYSKVICKIFNVISPGYLNEFVKRVLESEIENCNDSTVLFRANTLGSKIFEEYLDVVGREWRNDVLLPLIEEYFGFDYSFKERILQEMQLEDIRQFCLKVTHQIFASYEKCPIEIRHILNVISTKTSEKYDDPDLTHISISSFILLRLFTPAILCPKLFGLSVSYPSQVQTDNCTVLSSFIQKLANLTLFRENVKKMHVLNDILVSEEANMRGFVKNISRPVELALENSYEKENMGLYYEYSMFTRYFIRYRESFNTLDRQSKLFKFRSILDDIIFKIYQEYPNYWTEQHDIDADGQRNIENLIRKRDPQSARKRLHQSSSNLSVTRSREESNFNSVSTGDIRRTKKSVTTENLKTVKKKLKKKMPVVYTPSRENKYDSIVIKKKYRKSSNDLLTHAISYKSGSSDEIVSPPPLKINKMKNACNICGNMIQRMRKNYTEIQGLIYHTNCVYCSECRSTKQEELTLQEDNTFKCSLHLNSTT